MYCFPASRSLSTLLALELFVSSVEFERRHYHKNVMSFVIKRWGGGPDAPRACQRMRELHVASPVSPSGRFVRMFHGLAYSRGELRWTMNEADGKLGLPSGGLAAHFLASMRFGQGRIRGTQRGTQVSRPPPR